MRGEENGARRRDKDIGGRSPAEYASASEPDSVGTSSPQSHPPALRRTLPETYLKEYAPLLSGSAPMLAVKSIVEATADIDATVLIRGESGAGKEVVARAVHAASARHE